MSKKYAIHPGQVQSKSDGEIHFISAYQLMDLYGLARSECVIWDTRKPSSYAGLDPDDYVHLYPIYDGDYNLHGVALK